MAEDGGAPSVKHASRTFIIVLLLVALLMFVCLGLWVGLSVAIAKPDGAEASLIDGVSKTFTGCVGALLGLLGGKLS
jgi:hypothetical protein